MLIELSIENLALVEELELSIPPGFIAITGETGAGKSLLLTALSLLKGERASPELIRTGAEEAVVTGLFKLGDPELKNRLKDEGYPVEEPLLVRRILKRGGASRVYIQHRPATVQLLGELFSPHIQLYTQESEERLFTPRVQTSLLDRYGHLEEEARRVADLWEKLKKKEAEVARLKSQAPERERDLDYLEFTLGELERVNPKPGELATLEESLRLLHTKVRLKEIRELLMEKLRNGSPSVMELLFECEKLLAEGVRHDPSWQGWSVSIRELIERCDALAQVIRKVSLPQDDPHDPQGLEERLKELKRLFRKYGGAEEGVFRRWEEMKKEYETLLHLDEVLKESEEEVASLRELYQKEASSLSQARRRTALALVPRMEELLSTLALPRAHFRVEGFGAGEPGPQGTDRIEFLFTANPGEPAKPLRKVASGGERSRLLLALYTSMGGEFPSATLVFDEVDSGVGGETAHTIGQLLRRLAQEYQVLSVTHTPQVAAYATCQLCVTKEVRGEETHTRVKILSEEERLQELSRMLGDELSHEARAYARKLLALAQGISL